MIAATTDWTLYVGWSLVAVLSVLMVAMYAGMEMGIYTLNKIRLDVRADRGDRSARRLQKMLDNPSNLLVVLLIGTNMFNYLVTFAISAMYIASGAGRSAEIYTIATATPIMFILSESIPKNVFQVLAERLCYRLSWGIRASSVVFNACGLAPLVRTFSQVMVKFVPQPKKKGGELGDEHMTAIMAEGQASGVLSLFQTRMVDRVMRIRDVTLHDAMHPIAGAVTAPADLDAEQVRELARQHDYSRVPLINGGGKAVGILNLYDFLTSAQQQTPREMALSPLVLSDRMNVTDALYVMQRDHKVMAVVSNSDGRHIGIATIKDLVEEIVGELGEW